MYPRPLSELQHLSASSIASFQTCPHTWAAAQLYGVRSPMNKYASIGKTVHSVIEDHVVKREIQRDLSEIPPKEIESLIVYKENKVLQRSKQVVSVEHEFKLEWAPGVPPLYGFMDMVDVTDDGALRITDHKTNRNFESAADWRKKIQPPLYLYVAKRLWPDFPRHVFRLGYVNLDVEPLEWNWDAEMDAQLYSDVANAWNSMVFYSTCMGTKWGELSPLEGFPQRVHEYCGGCPVKDSCASFRHSTTTLLESLPFVSVTNEEKYIRLKAAEKAIKGLLDELEETIRAKVEANNGQWVHMGYAFTLESRSLRSADPKGLLNALDAAVKDHGESAAQLIDKFFEEMFSTKVGGIDKLVKAEPGFRKYIDPVLTKQSTNPSLKAKKL